MSTKHKPATPLPWHLGVKQANQVIYDTTGWAVANVTGPDVYEDKNESKENALYIAHAANAYPRLVEALRDIEMETRSGGQWTAAEINEVACSILRELGEE